METLRYNAILVTTRVWISVFIWRWVLCLVWVVSVPCHLFWFGSDGGYLYGSVGISSHKPFHSVPLHLQFILMSAPHPPLLCPSLVALMVVWTSKIMFPLLFILANLESHLCCIEVDLTIMANPLNPNPPPTLTSSNSEWEVTVVLKCPLLG